MQTIICDTRQHVGKHENKMQWWEAHSVPTITERLDAGDYTTEGSNIVIDTKRNVMEMSANICGKAGEHNRVRREMERARDNGLRLYFLIECVGFETVDDLVGWTNDVCVRCRYRCNPRNRREKCGKFGTRKPAQGDILVKTMKTMATRYGCRFEVVNPRESARRICELLGIDYEEGGGEDADDG